MAEPYLFNEDAKKKGTYDPQSAEDVHGHSSHMASENLPEEHKPLVSSPDSVGSNLPFGVLNLFSQAP